MPSTSLLTRRLARDTLQVYEKLSSLGLAVRVTVGRSEQPRSAQLASLLAILAFQALNLCYLGIPQQKLCHLAACSITHNPHAHIWVTACCVHGDVWEVVKLRHTWHDLHCT